MTLEQQQSTLSKTAKEVNPHLIEIHKEMRAEQLGKRGGIYAEMAEATGDLEAIPAGMEQKTLVDLANKIARKTEEIEIRGGQFTQENFELGSGETHSLKINQVNETNVEIEISSGPINFELNIGEKKEIDLNKDGKSDVIVKLETLESGEAVVNLTVLDAVTEGDKVDFRIHLAEVKSKVLSDPNLDERGRIIRTNFIRKLEAKTLGLA